MAVIPTTPPQVRLPTTGPSFASRNMAAKTSPSEPVVSFSRQTREPQKSVAG